MIEEERQMLHAIRARQGDEKAIAQLYSQHYSMLEQYIIANSGTKDDAADVIQETFIAFVDLVQKEKFRGEATIKSFLYTLTRNIWISELRKRKSLSERNEAFERAKDQYDKTVLDYLVRVESQYFIEEVFNNLGNSCKQLLTLFYYEKLSVKEIIKRTSFSNEQVARNKKYKCLKELIGRIKKSSTLEVELKSALKYGK